MPKHKIKNKYIDQIHQKLMNNSSWYASWHKQKHHQKAQWLLLVLVVAVFTVLLVNRINDKNAVSYGNASQAAQDQATPQSKGRILGSVPGEILVKFKPGTAASTMANVMASQGLANKEELAPIQVHILSFSGDRTPEAVAEALSHNPNVEFAEPNSIVEPSLTPNDPWYPSSFAWSLQNIKAPTAWDTTTGSSNVIIAICDTGINPVPDLNSKLVAGWNFVSNNSNTSDVFGHGTVVAGTAAAITNNAIGVAGVAWGPKIMPGKIGRDSDGVASYAAMAQCVTYAADHGSRVANLSYQASESSTVSDAAAYMQSKGGVVTSSAGNEADFNSGPENPYVLTVGASDSNDIIAVWSDYGNHQDVVAPMTAFSTFKDGTYSSASGTSISSPIVAGVAALVISVNPALTGAQVEAIIQKSADDRGPAGWDPQYGWGRVNAAKAVACASTFASTSTCPGASSGGTGDTQAPIISISSPTSGSTVSALATVSATASDNVGVVGVQFKLDGANLGAEDTTVPYSISWDTTTASNGNHTLSAVARDAAGNSTTASSVTVNVSNQAAFQITSFSASSTVGSITISWVTSSSSTGSVTLSDGTILSDQNPSTSHSLTFTGLTKSTKYNYTLKTTASDVTQVQVTQSGSVRTKNR